MNIFEYLTKDNKNKPYFDEDGNLYVDFEAIDNNMDDIPLGNGLKYFTDWEHLSDKPKGYYFITKEIYEKYANIEVTVADDINKSFWDIRRPYFRLRGKPVTQEQAFDIIRRTDCLLFCVDVIRESGKWIPYINFGNNILNKGHFENRAGWVHPDGLIGINDVPIEKYPELYDFIVEWLKYLAEFPYLDIMLAFSCWEEIPPEVWKMCDLIETWEYDKAYDEPFLKAIVFGIHVHDNKVEVLNSEKACAKYQEYDALYKEQRERFVADYYADNGIFEADLGYAKRCIALYGLDADEELNKLSKYLQEKFGME